MMTVIKKTNINIIISQFTLNIGCLKDNNGRVMISFCSFSSSLYLKTHHFKSLNNTTRWIYDGVISIDGYK